MDRGIKTSGHSQLRLQCIFTVKSMHQYELVESSRRSAGLQSVCGAARWSVDLGIVLYTWTSIHPPTPSTLLHHTWTAESCFTHSHCDEKNSPATACPAGNQATPNMHHPPVCVWTQSKQGFAHEHCGWCWIQFSVVWLLLSKCSHGHILSSDLFCCCHSSALHSKPTNAPSSQNNLTYIKCSVVVFWTDGHIWAAFRLGTNQAF